MPRHLTAPSSHSTRALVDGTWVTPSTTRPTMVNINLVAGDIDAGDTADFDIELRDGDDVAVTGFPLSYVINRSGLTGGGVDVEFAAALLVPAGYDYRVVDNSSGATGVSYNAIEDGI